MPKGKLTIETKEAAKFKAACDFTEIAVTGMKTFGDKTKVEVSYRSVDQIYTLGMIQNSIKLEDIQEVTSDDKKEASSKK